VNAFASAHVFAAASRFSPAPDSGQDRKRERPAGLNPAAWRLESFAGRLSELSGEPGGTPLTLVFGLVHEAQEQAEPVAWITSRDSTFFPPDADRRGIDLAALAVIRARDMLSAARAAEHLLRSAGFGLVVLDFGTDTRLPLHVQARLAGQARHHGAALVCLTEKAGDEPSLGSLVSLRGHCPIVQRQGRRFRCQTRILKDKHQGPDWFHEEVCRGPDGLH